MLMGIIVNWYWNICTTNLDIDESVRSLISTENNEMEKKTIWALNYEMVTDKLNNTVNPVLRKCTHTALDIINYKSLQEKGPYHKRYKNGNKQIDLHPTL